MIVLSLTGVPPATYRSQVLSRNYDQIRSHLSVFVGVPFHELAPLLGIAGIERPAVQRKAFAGDMAEAMLSIAKNSLPELDIGGIGAEVKTIPLDGDSEPRENTKVTSLTPAAVAEDEDFFTSRLYKKMRAVLFMPIQKTDNDEAHYWYLRPPFLWLPSAEQLKVMRSEYERYIEAIRNEDWEYLSLRNGRFLGVNTSGAMSARMDRADKPYAWWLKKELTREILADNLSAEPWVRAVAAGEPATRLEVGGDEAPSLFQAAEEEPPYA